MIKGCRSFAGMVNFVSLFCPKLQLLKPIYDLTREGDSFFGKKNNNKPLMRSNVDYKDLQSYIYPTDMDNSNCILTPANSLLVVHYTKFKMDNQNS